MTGNRIVKVLPVSSPSLCASTVPPWSSTSRRTTAKPMPNPLIAVCPRVNRSNNRGNVAASIPMPSSRTVIAISVSVSVAVTRIGSSGSLNLIALASTFWKTWRRRAGSPENHSG